MFTPTVWKDRVATTSATLLAVPNNGVWTINSAFTPAGSERKYTVFPDAPTELHKFLGMDDAISKFFAENAAVEFTDVSRRIVVPFSSAGLWTIHLSNDIIHLGELQFVPTGFQIRFSVGFTAQNMPPSLVTNLSK